MSCSSCSNSPRVVELDLSETDGEKGAIIYSDRSFIANCENSVISLETVGPPANSRGKRSVLRDDPLPSIVQPESGKKNLTIACSVGKEMVIFMLIQ